MAGINDMTYGEYLAECLSDYMQYSDYTEPKIDDSISYTKYVAESINDNVENNDYINFPIVQQVAARTIGLDLVAVQPMDAPIANLTYMEYNYDGDGIFEEVIIWHKDKTYSPDEFFNDDSFNEY